MPVATAIEAASRLRGSARRGHDIFARGPGRFLALSGADRADQAISAQWTASTTR